MPYIENWRRIQLAPILDLMKDKHALPDGDLNYLLYAYCKDTIVPGYANYRNYCAELRACATEIERRLLGPHEDFKKDNNGDIL